MTVANELESTSTGPWDDTTLAKLREWDPVWLDQCLKMSKDPWTCGVLPRKDVELISIAVNAACTNLNAGGTRRHIRGALEAGATREEILMIIKIASLLSIHTREPRRTDSAGRSESRRREAGPEQTVGDSGLRQDESQRANGTRAGTDSLKLTRRGRKRSSLRASRSTPAGSSLPSWRSY